MCKTRRTTSRLEGWENIEQYTKIIEFNDIRNDMMNRNLSSYTISRAAHSGQIEEHNDNEHHTSRWGQHILNTRMWLERFTRFLPPWLWEVYRHSYSNPTWVHELDRLELPARSNILGGVTGNNDVLSLARYWLTAVISQLVEADVLPLFRLDFCHCNLRTSSTTKSWSFFVGQYDSLYCKLHVFTNIPGAWKVFSQSAHCGRLRDEPRIFIGQLNGFLSKSSAYRSAVIEHHHNYYSKVFAGWYYQTMRPFPIQIIHFHYIINNRLFSSKDGLLYPGSNGLLTPELPHGRNLLESQVLRNVFQFLESFNFKPQMTA